MVAMPHWLIRRDIGAAKRATLDGLRSFRWSRRIGRLPHDRNRFGWPCWGVDIQIGDTVYTACQLVGWSIGSADEPQ